MPNPFKPKPKVIAPPAPTAPGGHSMPHADSPRVVADSADTPTPSAVIGGWKCPADGQMNAGIRCTTCGTVGKA